jgi:hypothetical protein
MSNEQEPKNVENEPKPAEELDNQALDQVVGGALPTVSPTLTAPTLPPTESITLNFAKVNIEYKAQ